MFIVKDPAIEIINILYCAQQTTAFITCLLTLCIFITVFKPGYSQKGGCYGVVTGIFVCCFGAKAEKELEQVLLK